MEEVESSDSVLAEAKECESELTSVLEDYDCNLTNPEACLEGQTDNNDFLPDMDKKFDNDKFNADHDKKCAIDKVSYHETEGQNCQENRDSHTFVYDQQGKSESLSSYDSVHNFSSAGTSLISGEDCSKDSSMNCEEVPVRTEIYRSLEDTEENFQSDMLQSIRIETITINEDEDLFDFEHTEAKAADAAKDFQNDATKCSDKNLVDTEVTSTFIGEEQQMDEEEVNENLQSSELYRYLTAPNIDDIKSSEVTPQHSDHEMTPRQSDHDSNEESDSDSDSDSSSTGSYTPASSEEDNKAEVFQNQSQTGKPSVEPTENNVVQKPKPSPAVKKPFRPRMTKKMRTLLAKTTERLKKSKEVTDRWLKELELPKNLDLSNQVMLKVSELNQYLTCGLCSGYLYEASTVTECMHTFCKTCIVRHCMEVSLNCPVCNILIHPTDPFVNIRLDRMIQDIVYKLLPNVAEAEMKNISEFYADHPEVESKELNHYPGRPKISPAKTEEFTDSVPLVSLVLESEGESPKETEQLEKKFVRVKGSATVANLSHFLKKKLCLEDSKDVDIFCCGDIIEEKTSTLEKLREKFFNNEEECLMLLQFRVHDYLKS